MRVHLCKCSLCADLYSCLPTIGVEHVLQSSEKNTEEHSLKLKEALQFQELLQVIVFNLFTDKPLFPKGLGWTP